MSDRASTSDPRPASEPESEGATHEQPHSTSGNAPSTPPTDGEPELRITPTWVIVGIAAMLLGLLAGFVMSSSWLR